MLRSPSDFAVAAFRYSFAAVVAMPLCFFLAAFFIMSMPRGEASAAALAALVVLSSIVSIALAVRGMKLAWEARREQLPDQRSGEAIPALICFAAIFGLLGAWGFFLLVGASSGAPASDLAWAAIPLVPSVAALAWVIIAVRRHGLRYSLLPPLAIPLASLALCIGLLGLAAAVPLYSVQRSCGPSVYSFDGTEFVLEGEPYAGAILEERTGYSCLRHLRPVGGNCRLKMANELDETQYTDQLSLLVVDHSAAAEVVPDAEGNLHTIVAPLRPVAASESSGDDLCDRISAEDGRFWESRTGTDRRCGAFGERVELLLDFPKPPGARQAKLAVTASNTPAASSNSAGFLKLCGACYPLVNAVRSEARKGYIRFEVQVHTGHGWATRGAVRGADPRLPREQVVVLDVGDVPGDRLRLRMPLAAEYWRIGNVRVDYSPDEPLKICELAPSEACGQDGSDIRALLRSDDGASYVTTKGDLATLSFAEPPPVPGTARSFILKARGYYAIRGL